MKKENLEFFVPLKNIPRTTHQQKKVNLKTGNFYEDEKLQNAREIFMSHFSRFRPDEKLTGPIRLITKWFYPTQSSTHQDGDWKITSPDTDNLVKLPKDCMTTLGFWKDDALVASEIIEKFWVKESPSGVYVKIEKLGVNAK